ncbi:MAG: DUF2917 domain-containing protein [Rhodocyclaceae bacterium]|nr:DUF2917 domain-containing protein [Rhodocyclaceae bacterium]
MIKNGAGLEIRAMSGCVWITQYGDARDVVLSPGQSVQLDLPTTTVLSTGKGAEVALIRRAARPAARPLWRRLASLFDPRGSSGAGRALAGRIPGQRVIHC